MSVVINSYQRGRPSKVEAATVIETSWAGDSRSFLLGSRLRSCKDCPADESHASSGGRRGPTATVQGDTIEIERRSCSRCSGGRWGGRQEEPSAGSRPNKMRTDDVAKTLATLFSELVAGAPPSGGYMLNAGDEGLLASLDRLSAARASALTPTGSSVAAHVDHLRYGLSLMNRWNAGENPFDDADWST